MSGIYGYYLRQAETAEAQSTETQFAETQSLETKSTDAYRKALTCWNSVYGSHALHTEPNKGQFFGVNLEHLSSKIPEQTAFLDTPAYTAVIDALIFNRTELIEQYGIGSSDLSAMSDEELLFSIITEHGMDALAGINGDFAGVLYDKKAHTYTIFRDHLGVRPLFYYLDENRFVFSTDMRAFLAIPGLDISIDERVLYCKLTDKLVADGNDCDFNHIHIAPFASGIILDCNQETLQISQPVRYWTYNTKTIRLKDERAYQKELRRLIEDAVQRRMDAVDGLIGAELSGGLDSSVLSILIHRLGREGRYFSWSLSPEELPIIRPDDERNIIDAVCRQEGFSVKYNARELDFSIPHIFDRLFPPYANTSTISEGSNWFHSQGAKAIFTGHGGDQGVSHRGKIYELYLYKEYWKYFKALYRMREGRKLRLLRTIRAYIKDSITYRKRPMNAINSDAIVLSGFLNPDFYKRISESTQEFPFTFGYDIPKLLDHGFHTNRPMNTAFQAAQYGVRYLFPYLDYRVMDYAVSIPRWLYNDGVENRKIYIEAFRDILPETLLKNFKKQTVSKMRSDKDSGAAKEEIDSMNNRIQILAARLDPELWSPYLDLEKLKEYKLPYDATNDDISLAAYRTEYIFYCVNLQNTWQHAIDPVTAAEKEDALQ